MTTTPILVTGSHRSGTTWVGKVLASAPKTAYVQEPFNPIIPYDFVTPAFPYWFQYINGQNALEFDEQVERIMHQRYPLVANIKQAKTLKGVAKVLLNQYRAIANRVCSNRLILKDPIAFFSASWLAQTYDLNVLVTIRHPAAFCSSLKLKAWAFDFNHFLNQPLLMAGLLKPYRAEIEKFARHQPDLIDQGILLWNCIHQSILLYQNSQPDWLFVKHEELSYRPEEAFRDIFKQLNLPYTPAVVRYIARSSGEHNPAEQQRNKEFSRNSLQNIHNWKTRLGPQDIDRIRRGTEPVAQHFYSSEDWVT